MCRNKKERLLQYLPTIKHFCGDYFYYLEDEEGESVPAAYCISLTELSTFVGNHLSSISRAYTAKTRIYYQGVPYYIKKDKIQLSTKHDFWNDIKKYIYEDCGLDIAAIFPTIHTPQKLYNQLTNIKRAAKNEYKSNI